MEIYGRTQPLAKYPILEGLEVLRNLGFDGVEICLENDDLHPTDLSLERIHAVRRQAERLGFSSWSVSYHKDYIHDEALFEQTLHAIYLTPKFGARVFVFAGWLKTEDPNEWGRMVDRIRIMVDAARQRDVTLAMEFEPGFVVGCTADLLRLLAEIPSMHLTANLDLGHVFLCDPDPMAAIASLAGKISHVHVENMASGVHEHLLPQEGDMDLPAYLAALRKIGFDGPMALDLYKQDYEAVAPECLAYLRNTLAGLK